MLIIIIINNKTPKSSYNSIISNAEMYKIPVVQPKQPENIIKMFI